MKLQAGATVPLLDEATEIIDKHMYTYSKQEVQVEM